MPPSLLESMDRGSISRSSSTDDLPLPSPPYYRRAPSHSHLRYDNLSTEPHDDYDEALPSPAYSSRVDVHMSGREKEPFPSAESSPTDAQKHAQKPSVHYPETLLRSAYYNHGRNESVDFLSRPPSVAGTDDEYEEEDYDWSGEDDLVDQEAAFQERMGSKSAPEKWGFKRFITFLFSSLIGSTFLAGVLVTPALLVHFYWYKPHPANRKYTNQNIQAWLFWAAANLLLSWYLALFVDLVPVVATAIISGAWGHVSESIRSRVEMYNSVKNTIKPLFYAASGWASWHIIFADIYHLYDPNDPDHSWAPYTSRLQQVMAFLFFFTLVICAQRMLSHAVAFSFHRTAFKDRVDAVNNTLSVIEALRDYRPKSASAPRSGGRTPILGALGLSSLGIGIGLPPRGIGTPGAGGINEKEHYKFLTSALKRHKKGMGRSATEDTADTSDSRPTKVYDGDTEDCDTDGDRTVVGSMAARSTFRKGKSRDDTVEIPLTPSPARMRVASPPPLMVTEPSPVQHQYPPPRSRPSSGYFGAGSPMYRSPRTSIDGSNSTGGAASRVEAVGEKVGEAVEAAAKVLKAAAMHDARNIRGNDDKDGEGINALTWNVSSSREAKRLARAIYYRFKDRRRQYLLPSDFYPAFPSTDAAEAAFRVFDTDNNGDISRAEIKTTLVKVYKERRFLSRSMRDVGVALKTLDQILLFFALVILFFISLSVFGVEVGNSLTSVYSLGIAASFIFKNAASSAFDAIMFLFVTHPFDTGDRVFIDDENLVVKKMGLFATVFTRSDGTETYYFNSLLFSKFITNVRRSGKTAENLTMQVAWRTPLIRLDALEKNLNEWLSTHENRWFEPSTNIVLQHIDFQRSLEVTIGIGHNGNWQDWGMRNARKTAFHAAVNYYCRQLGIECANSAIPLVFTDTQAPGEAPAAAAAVGAGNPSQADFSSPELSSTGVGVEEVDAEAAERQAKDMKPMLGFLPPLATRTANLRARKSKGKKAMLRTMDG